MLGFSSLPAKLNWRKQAGVLSQSQSIPQLILKQIPLARGPVRCYSITGTWLWQQDPGLTATHHHHSTAGATANIQAGTPKSGWKSLRGAKRVWEYLGTFLCVYACMRKDTKYCGMKTSCYSCWSSSTSTPDRNSLSKPFVSIAMIPEYTFRERTEDDVPIHAV